MALIKESSASVPYNSRVPPSRVRLTASNIFVKDNTGIVINLFPYTNSQGYITNSVFNNNTCLTLATITVRSNGKIISLNNIFANNNNFVGVIYLNIEAPVTGLYNVYLNNTGIFASTLYMESTEQAYEGLAKVYWNHINPQVKVSDDGMIPQAGMYFISYSGFIVFYSLFKENVAYSGIMTTYTGEVVFYDCLIADNTITGSSIMGTFLALNTLYHAKHCAKKQHHNQGPLNT